MPIIESISDIEPKDRTAKNLAQLDLHCDPKHEAISLAAKFLVKQGQGHLIFYIYYETQTTLWTRSNERRYVTPDDWMDWME